MPENTVEAKSKSEFKIEIHGLWVFGSLASRGGCSCRGRSWQSQGNSEAGKESGLTDAFGKALPWTLSSFLSNVDLSQTAEEMERKEKGERRKTTKP